MSYPPTKLNPTAPSFPPVEAPTTLRSAMPPTPPPEDSLNMENDITVKTFDTAKLPGWMLVEENEKLRVAALSLSKTTTRDEWVTRLQHFSDLLAPGFAIVSSDGVSRAAWRPLAVRQMPPPLQPDLTTHGATFTMNFIQNELRGVEWSPGFYFIHPKDRREGSKLTAYWILDADLDPYLPKQPGEHGAKLTPFFNSTMSGPGEAPSEEDYINTPVFIGNNYRSEYRYFGHYSQTRFSDKLDYERIVDGTVPPFVLDVWAKALTQPDLTTWTKNELREHIWPKPTYHGPLPLGSPCGSPGSDGSQSPAAADVSKAHDRRVKKAIQRYSEELQAWEIDSKLRLSMLKEADIHRLFHAADSDEQVGLRLWFEYLQCTSYEDSFYERMVELKYNENQQRGYHEKIDGLMRQGWRWQLVEKTTGSGHTAMEHKLCPPQAKARVSAARKDSAIGSEKGFPASRGSKPEKVVTTFSAAEEIFENDKVSLTPHNNLAPSAPQRQALPPHLRGKTNKPAQETGKQEPTTTGTDTQKTTTAGRSATNLFSLGDLEEAKRMQSSFTRAGARRKGGSNFPGGHHSLEQIMNRHDPMDQGWARAGRNPKPIAIDSNKDVLW